jgi:quinol monooxygenase YgiN
MGPGSAERHEECRTASGTRTKRFNMDGSFPNVRRLQQKHREDFVIYVVATLTIKPGTAAEFIAGAKACIAETVKEPGCISYDLTESVTDPSKFVFVEQWEDADALGPHGASDHMRAWRRIVKECISAPPRIEIITPEKVDVR